jgi:hypothetical protein
LVFFLHGLGGVLNFKQVINTEEIFFKVLFSLEQQGHACHIKASTFCVEFSLAEPQFLPHDA